MPRISSKRYDYELRDAMKSLRGELAAEGITLSQVGEWIGCSGQNVGAHLRHGTFSFKQMLIIRGNLDLFKESEHA